MTIMAGSLHLILKLERGWGGGRRNKREREVGRERECLGLLKPQIKSHLQ